LVGRRAGGKAWYVAVDLAMGLGMRVRDALGDGPWDKIGNEYFYGFRDGYLQL
jgi:hypothetical protein